MVYLRSINVIDIEKDIYKIRRFFEGKVSGYQETALTAFTLQVLLDILSIKTEQENLVFSAENVVLQRAIEAGIVVGKDEEQTFMELLRVRHLLTASVSNASTSIKTHLCNVSYADTVHIFNRALTLVNAYDDVKEDCKEILKKIFAHRKYGKDFIEEVFADM